MTITCKSWRIFLFRFGLLSYADSWHFDVSPTATNKAKVCAGFGNSTPCWL